MNVEKLCVVFDCMIYLQAFLGETSLSTKLFDLLDKDAFILFTSQPILDELRNVLSRPKLRAKYSQITDIRVDAFVQRISQKATLIKYISPAFRYPRDPKDEKYIDLAVAVKAEYIVSHDKDLLDLMSGYTDDAKEFRQRFRFLNVIKPLEFLGKVELQRMSQ